MSRPRDTWRKCRSAAPRWQGATSDTLPVDAHTLISSIAPRPLLLQTGDKDFWSDPKGEFLAAVAASPVYTLFGKEALGTNQMPPVGTPIFHTLG